MRFKPVPHPPPTLDDLGSIHRAVPLVPQAAADCRSRLRNRRSDIVTRADAEAWLTFLRAIGLVTKGETGYRRTGTGTDRRAMADALLERVFMARAVHDVLVERPTPVTARDVFEDVVEEVPRWERHRSDRWETIWEERTERLLEWFVLLGIADRGDGGYRAADR